MKVRRHSCLDAMIRGHAHPQRVKRRSFVYTLERGKRYVGRVLSRIELIAWKTLETKPLSTLVTLPNTNVHPHSIDDGMPIMLFD